MTAHAPFDLPPATTSKQAFERPSDINRISCNNTLLASPSCCTSPLTLRTNVNTNRFAL